MNRERKRFLVSKRIIWGSSVALGILSSIPKFFLPGSSLREMIINSSITTLFSVGIWYYNIYALPKFTSRRTGGKFLSGRLILSVVMGIILMVVLVIVHQEIFYATQLDTPIMFEVRAILINLIVYLFLHLLFQNYQTQQLGEQLELTTSLNLGAQYELLKQQVNPHFLFNSLNTLKSMVEMSDPQSVQFILNLSDFYRFTLESRKLDVITLKEELEILQAYTFLLKARFEEGFLLSDQISPEYHNTAIPPFTLQLLIENCIKHNIVSIGKPLQIRLYVQKDFIVVENQIQLKKGVPSSGIGLDNINQRYSHLIDKEIEIENTETVFKVKIPIIHDYHHH